MKLADIRPGLRVRRVSSGTSFVKDGPSCSGSTRRTYVVIEVLERDPRRPTARMARVQLEGTDLEETIQIHRLEPAPD